MWCSEDKNRPAKRAKCTAQTQRTPLDHPFALLLLSRALKRKEKIGDFDPPKRGSNPSFKEEWTKTKRTLLTHQLWHRPTRPRVSSQSSRQRSCCSNRRRWQTRSRRRATSRLLFSWNWNLLFHSMMISRAKERLLFHSWNCCLRYRRPSSCE